MFSFEKAPSKARACKRQGAKPQKSENCHFESSPSTEGCQNELKNQRLRTCDLMRSTDVTDFMLSSKGRKVSSLYPTTSPCVMSDKPSNFCVLSHANHRCE